MKTPQQIEWEIAAFVGDKGMIQEHLAMLKVGHNKGDSPERMMAIIIASALFRFHKMPMKPKS